MEDSYWRYSPRAQANSVQVRSQQSSLDERRKQRVFSFRVHFKENQPKALTVTASAFLIAWCSIDLIQGGSHAHKSKTNREHGYCSDHAAQQPYGYGRHCTDASAASPGGSISSGKLRFLAGYCPCPGRRCYCYFFRKTD